MNQYQKACWAVDLGMLPYAQACELQQRLVEARQARVVPDVLLLCEHPHVITLGRNAKRQNLLASNQMLAQMNAELHPTNRGGDITYHGPGQIVSYPILDLTEHHRDVRWYVEQLEEVMIRTTADFGLAAHRVEGQHGAWIDATSGEEKLGAIGVHLGRWVTSHGFAYNVSADLRYFNLIVPCGIADKRVTSLERALGHPVPIGQVRDHVITHFATTFGFEMKRISSEELTRALRSVLVSASV